MRREEEHRVHSKHGESLKTDLNIVTRVRPCMQTPVPGVM